MIRMEKYMIRDNIHDIDRKINYFYYNMKGLYEVD